MFDGFKGFTNGNYFFGLDIKRSYSYSNWRKRSRDEIPKTNLSGVLGFVKRDNRVGFDFEKVQGGYEYCGYLITTYFEYYIKSSESFLELLGYKIGGVNGGRSGEFVQTEHDILYYLRILK